MDINDIATGHDHVEIHIAGKEHGGNVDFLTEGLALANAGNNRDVGTNADRTTGRGQHVADTRVAGFNREAPRAVNQPKDCLLYTSRCV